VLCASAAAQLRTCSPRPDTSASLTLFSCCVRAVQHHIHTSCMHTQYPHTPPVHHTDTDTDTAYTPTPTPHTTPHRHHTNTEGEYHICTGAASLNLTLTLALTHGGSCHRAASTRVLRRAAAAALQRCCDSDVTVSEEEQRHRCMRIARMFAHIYSTVGACGEGCSCRMFAARSLIHSAAAAYFAPSHVLYDVPHRDRPSRCRPPPGSA
jgi:hypothetical protein